MYPVCDIDPEHGEMQVEPMYGKGGEILQYGYFCTTPDCDGYGGPAKRTAPARKTRPVSEAEQIEMEL
jgi:hypothetical protein